MNQTNGKTAILLVSCPDRVGLTASVTQLLHRYNGNILHLDQHVDTEENVFFMRLEWDLAHFAIPMEDFEREWARMAQEFQMRWELRFSARVPRMAIFVSRLPHCLYDILARFRSGELPVEVPMVVSNHPTLEPVVKKFGLNFYHIPIGPENKALQEERELRLLADYRIDFIVLARYMQILSENFVRHYPNRIINIHHSFLPAFPGARPYHSAYARGVKIIGATSHYVTPELDAGPIIEQDVIRVSHSDSLQDIIRKGKDLEKIVLSRAIWAHLQNKILVYNNKTVIFR